MSIEKPISTIKQAVEYSSQDMPEPKDYKTVFEVFRNIKKTNPKMFERLVSYQAKNIELRKEMGIELYKEYSNIWQEIYSRYIENLANLNKAESILGVFKSKNLEETKFIKVREEITNDLKNDLRIISLFKDNEKLLNKVVDLSVSEIFDFINTPDLRTFSLRFFNDSDNG